MATQGLLSIVVGGKVIAKAIVGADGYEMPAIAADVRANNVITAQGFSTCATSTDWVGSR